MPSSPRVSHGVKSTKNSQAAEKQTLEQMTKLNLQAITQANNPGK